MARTQPPIENSTFPKFRSVPTEIAPHESVTATKSDIEPFEPSYSDRENGVLATYLHQIGRIRRLTREEELSLFTKIGKYRKRIDEYYQELATHLPDISLEKPPHPNALKQQILAYQNFNCTYLLDLVRQIQFIQDKIHATKNRIVEANLRLVVCIAKKFQERGLDLLDLIQEANIGLMNAIDHFDWQRDVRFSAYASWWIQQAVGCGIANNGRTIRIPAYLLGELRKVNRAKADLYQKGSVDASLEEVADKTGFAVEKLIKLDQLAAATISLGACISEETGGTIEDTLPCQQTHNPLAEMIGQNLIKDVTDAVAELPSREKQIVSLRYGLEDGEERSLQEVGSVLNLSRERIRQIEARALNRLRHPTRSERLQEFLTMA
ncbi:sigma-70 family RNA polymerase sigma factor [Candidatus Poribacteria bacterium]|nr:sigma-70 family RNA polymerase sigma factor [Candidatus Poribacteria bacterium]